MAKLQGGFAFSVLIHNMDVRHLYKTVVKNQVSDNALLTVKCHSYTK